MKEDQSFLPEWICKLENTAGLGAEEDEGNFYEKEQQRYTVDQLVWEKNLDTMTMDGSLSTKNWVSLLWLQAFVMKYALWHASCCSCFIFKALLILGLNPRLKIWAQFAYVKYVKTCSSQIILEINISVAILIVNSETHSLVDLLITALFDGFSNFCSLSDIGIIPKDFYMRKAIPAHSLVAHCYFLYSYHVMWVFSFPQFAYLT